MAGSLLIAILPSSVILVGTGAVTVGSQGGPVRAQTVNGRVNARLDAVRADVALLLAAALRDASAIGWPRITAP